MTSELAQDDEISLLDLLLVVAENIKLLVVGPLVTGLIALGVAYQLPQSFVSQAILALPTSTSTSAQTPNQTPTPTSAQTPTPTQAAAMMTSPVVLDPVIESLGLTKGKPIQIARHGVAGQIKATVGKDFLLRLDVTAPTAADAQALANAVIDTWLKSTVPAEQERQDLETRLAYAQNGLKAVTTLLDRLATEGGKSLNKPLTRGDAGTGLVAVGELQSRYLADVLSIPRSLQGLSRDVVKQPPTLPTEPLSAKKGLIATLSALGAGFTLLLFVFIRQAWRSTAADPESARKQILILSALGLKPLSVLRE
jgi:capsular polysaccharide biosynthesis protein